MDDNSGSTQEFTTIQAAANIAQPGDTILVYPGIYQGFSSVNSGTSSSPITFKANGAVIINTATSTGYGIYLKNTSYVTIDGFQVQNVSQNCIAAREGSPTSPMRGVIIRNNTCTQSGREGIYVSEIQNSLVENNTVSNINGTNAHGIYVANAGSDNTTVRGNTIYGIHGTEAAGIHCNGDLSVGGDGIISGLTIENNTIYDIYFNGVSLDGVQSATFRNNLIYKTSKHSVRAFQIDGAQGPKNYTFVNNTFVVQTSGNYGVKISEDLGGHTFFNNILVSSGSSGGSISVPSPANLKSDYNVVLNALSSNDDSSTSTLLSWQATGNDRNSVVSSSSALFTNPSAGDYSLLSTAPAVNKGVASFNGVSAPTVDRVGTARPQGGAFDIGAYER